MKKKELINQFTKSLIVEEKRKNKVTTQNITSTLITTCLSLAFVNETCKSTGKISKSQVIYRKLYDKTKSEILQFYRECTIKFLKLLKIFGRNRKFMISFDTTKEAFYGDFSKAEDKLYLHEGSIAKESYFYYEFMTSSITCKGNSKYILDGIILPVGAYIEDYVFDMLEFITKHLSIELVLFDRGFTSWGVIYFLRKLKVDYLIFWKKHGNWYKPHFNELSDGDIKSIKRTSKYNRNKSTYKVDSDFVLIKQHEYETKKYDWIFASNIKLDSAKHYIMRYKKRWIIETIYRVTDKIRAYTTSTKSIIRYFLFMFTCLVYNLWRFFQMFLTETFTLANFKINMIIYLAKIGLIYPKQFDTFEKIAHSTIFPN